MSENLRPEIEEILGPVFVEIGESADLGVPFESTGMLIDAAEQIWLAAYLKCTEIDKAHIEKIYARHTEELKEAQRKAWHAARKFKASDNNPGMVLFEYESFDEWKNEKDKEEEA